ncbi:hypothetical protein QQX98_002253 [Neonectria punicea]|uniref:Xylanolytic transcriptional activator regulatory domain-containing protein n=1 Tax=Neonectria punicea TaxID=979145 RepID=A0ABR1HJR6_9HYPO
MDDDNSPFQDGDAPGDGPDDVSDSAQNNASSSSVRRAIDLIDRRLEGVTRLLQEMKTTMPSPNSQLSVHSKDSPQDRASQPSASSTSTPFGHSVQPASDSPVIEAESSLVAHSVFANEFLQNAVGTDSLQGAGLEMRETLDSLHHIVDALKQQTPATEMVYTMANQTPRPTLPGIKLPPIQKTVALVRRYKSEHSDKATWIFDVCPLDNFSDICLGFYFSEDYSEADFIISNTGMMYLFQELAGSEAEGKEENLSYFEMCRTNIETALNNLPLHLPANPNMIAALVLGAYHAIEISKPSLSWILTCKASELCQTLGYHRLSSLKGPTDKKDRKQFLFWSVYFMDKSLSLRLGRASTIQDWDISVPLPAAEDTHITPLSAFFSMWVKTARCQGNIYEQLYSPDSVTQPRYVRAAQVAAITKDLEDIRKQTSEVSVIETQDERDLASLHNFVNSIETVPMVSDAAAKMHRLFQVLYTVALRFVEFRNSTPPPDQTQANAELNTYLAALGFPSAGQDQRQLETLPIQGFGQPQEEIGLVDELNGERGTNPMMWMGNSAQLEDWFNSNNQMMELIEEPTFTFPQ